VKRPFWVWSSIEAKEEKPKQIKTATKTSFLTSTRYARNGGPSKTAMSHRINPIKDKQNGVGILMKQSHSEHREQILKLYRWTKKGGNSSRKDSKILSSTMTGIMVRFQILSFHQVYY